MVVVIHHLFINLIFLIMSALAATAIAAGSAIAGNLIGNASAKKQYKYNLKLQKQAQEYNTREREATQAWNLEQWNRENAYNTPLAQRQRLQDAGYNPYMTQDGSEAGRVQSTPMSSGANSVGLPDTGRYIAQAGEQIANLLYNRKKVNSETNKNNAEATRNMADAGLIGSNQKRIESLLPYEQQQINAYISNLAEDSKLKQEMSNLTAAKSIGQKLGNKWQEIANKYADENQRQQLVLLASQISNSIKDLDLKDAQVKELVSRAVSNYAEANFKNVNSDRVKQDIEYLSKTMADAIQAQNWQNRLDAVMSANLYVPEMRYGYKNATLHYKHQMYQLKRDAHLMEGSSSYYNKFKPEHANMLRGMYDIFGSGAKEALPIGMWMMTKGKYRGLTE